MPLVGPALLFHDLPIIVIFDPAVPLPEARRVHAAIHGLVVRLADAGEKADALPDAVAALVAESGYSARLIARTRHTMEFSVASK
jgi:hypothetical protein